MAGDTIYTTVDLGNHIVNKDGNTLDIYEKDGTELNVPTSGLKVVGATSELVTDDVDLTLKMSIGSVNPAAQLGTNSALIIDGIPYLFSEIGGVTNKNVINGLETFAVDMGSKDTDAKKIVLPENFSTLELKIGTVTTVNSFNFDVDFVVELDGTELMTVQAASSLSTNTSPQTHTIDILSLFLDNLPEQYAT